MGDAKEIDETYARRFGGFISGIEVRIFFISFQTLMQYIATVEI